MKLVLHIGGAKCGSSAIQQYLAANAAMLREKNGTLIPGIRLDSASAIQGEQIWFFQNLVNAENSEQVTFKRLSALHAEMKKEGLHTLVVSAENLINKHGLEKFFTRASDLFDVHVVAYVRRQDEYFASAWQQWHLKSYSSVQEWLDQKLGFDANWSSMLEPWEELFGRDRISVRRFQRANLKNGDVVADFLDLTGLKTEGCVPNARLANPSFDESLGSIAHRIRDVFSSPHDNEFYGDMFYAVGPTLFKSYKGSILFSLDERRKIFAAYDESNRILRERYFSSLPEHEPLFEGPDESDVLTLTDMEMLRRENDILARAVAGLSRRLRKLENAKQ